MARNTASAPMFNPLMLPWTDLGLRALDTWMASSQNVGEQVDRAARKTAAESAETLTEETSHATEPFTAAALASFSQMQLAGWQWMAQAWQQWFNTVAAFNPLRLQQDSAAVDRQAKATLLNALPGPIVPVAPARAIVRADENTQEREHAAAAETRSRRGARAKAGGARKGRGRAK
jgi:hypothetical protein